MGNILDYVKNSRRFRELDLHDSAIDDAEISKAIRKCFKYAQDRARE